MYIVFVNLYRACACILCVCMYIVLMCLYCVCVVILCLCSYTVFVYLYCVCVCVLCSCVYMLFVYLCCVRAVISCLWAAMVARVSFLFRSFGFTWVFRMCVSVCIGSFWYSRGFVSVWISECVSVVQRCLREGPWSGAPLGCVSQRKMRLA
jgi:hypothetical protein